MTVHNSKGLEFRAVFVSGLEEDLFPHINSKESLDDVEEERRLYYVALTRAKEKLYLSYSSKRGLWGSFRSMRASRFLREIPEKLMKRSSVSPVVRPFFETLEPLHTPKVEIKPVVLKFEVGEIIFHDQFGVGRIEAISESPVGILYDVLFTTDNLVRKIVAHLAPIRRL